MSSFNDLKRSSASNMDQLNKELAKLNTPSGRTADARIWSCLTDKMGNGNAIIRFLPAPGAEDVPFARMWSHGFKGAGGWYIENSLTTLGGAPDPVSEWNTELWNSGRDSDKKIVSGSGKENPGTKRQLSYYSNIYVVKDPANPDNEGKVFLFRYGKKIFDKLSELMNPPEDPIDPKSPVNPFDLWVGANFKLKIRRVEGYANFDSSSFAETGPLLDDDDKLEAIWKSEYSLAEIVAPDKFKSYDELKTKLARVRGLAGVRSDTASTLRKEQTEAPAQKQASTPVWDKPDATSTAGGDDEDLAFFKSIMDDD